MTLEEAEKKILDEKILPETGAISEYENFWFFHYVEEVDDCPPAIRKDAGSLFCFFYPDYSHLKYTVLNG